MGILVCPSLVHPLVPSANKNVKFEFLGQSQRLIGQIQSQRLTGQSQSQKLTFGQN
jgi:hypothetical protein